jgi:hypothetical protein
MIKAMAREWRQRYGGVTFMIRPKFVGKPLMDLRCCELGRTTTMDCEDARTAGWDKGTGPSSVSTQDSTAPSASPHRMDRVHDQREGEAKPGSGASSLALLPGDAAERDCARRVSRSRLVRSGADERFGDVRSGRTLLRLACDTAAVRPRIIRQSPGSPHRLDIGTWNRNIRAAARDRSDRLAGQR